MADRPASRKVGGGNKKKRRKAARGEANRGRSQPVPPQPSPSPLPTLVRAPLQALLQSLARLIQQVRGIYTLRRGLLNQTDHNDGSM